MYCYLSLGMSLQSMFDRPNFFAMIVKSGDIGQLPVDYYEMCMMVKFGIKLCAMKASHFSLSQETWVLF